MVFKSGWPGNVVFVTFLVEIVVFLHCQDGRLDIGKLLENTKLVGRRKLGFRELRDKLWWSSISLELKAKQTAAYFTWNQRKSCTGVASSCTDPRKIILDTKIFVFAENSYLTCFVFPTTYHIVLCIWYPGLLCIVPLSLYLLDPGGFCPKACLPHGLLLPN